MAEKFGHTEGFFLYRRRFSPPHRGVEIVQQSGANVLQDVSETEESSSGSSSELTSPTDLRYFAICCLFTIVIVLICVSFLKQASMLRDAHNELVVVDVVVVGDGHDICSTPPS